MVGPCGEVDVSDEMTRPSLQVLHLDVTDVKVSEALYPTQAHFIPATVEDRLVFVFP